MSRCSKLLDKARTNPSGLRFQELCRLAECWGYVHVSSKGSHAKYKHEKLKLPTEHAMKVFQDVGGEAKPYQVRQLLEAIEFFEATFPST